MTNNLINGLEERISNAININQSLGIIFPCNNYSDLIDALFKFIQNTPENIWIYLTVTRPYDDIFKQNQYLTNMDNISFIDCVSRAAGISSFHPNCIYIDSPSVLETIILKIMGTFRNINKDTQKNLIIDSISSLLIYNDIPLVTEFLTHLINRTKISGIHTITLAIEEESNDTINKILYLRNDKIIRVKESFI
jgi:hypothetical protein